MFLSKHSNGTYYVFYEDRKGKRRSKTTKTKHKKEAIRFLTQFKKKVEAESLQEVPPITFRRYSFSYLVRNEPFYTQKTIAVYKTVIKFFLKHLGDHNLTEYSTRMIEDYLLSRSIKSSIYASRRDLICLSAIFTKSVREGYLMKSPTAGIKRIKLPEIQPTFFSKDELDKLLISMDDNQDLRDLTIVAVNTGLRYAELISLTWNQIDFQNKFVILNNQGHITKSRKVRSIPLNSDAYEVLEKRNNNKPIDLENVFTMFDKPLNPNTLSQHFKKYVIKSNINSKLHFHSLRHTFASFLVQSGCSIYIVSKLLGHSDIKTTMIYSHLTTGELTAAVNQLTTTRIIPQIT